MLHLQTLMAQQLAEEVVAARGFGRALVNNFFCSDAAAIGSGSELKERSGKLEAERGSEGSHEILFYKSY